MCWMSIFRGEDAAARALEACSEHEETSGGHSWGVAAPVDGRMVTAKAVGNIPVTAYELIPDAEVALAHTRKATRGEIVTENAHPFPVRDRDGKAVAALAHNGTWYGAPDGDRCDSYYIARLLESQYRADPDRPFEELVEQTGRITGETLTVIHRDGRGFCYAGRFGITEGEECLKSSGGTPIPEGSVRQI